MDGDREHGERGLLAEYVAFLREHPLLYLVPVGLVLALLLFVLLRGGGAFAPFGYQLF